ncbi:hypothetical protein Q3G72_025887 [Acer saccharum]|nr:hypothetical protein Q3G72_025887 [Acer saccharum]
MSPPTTTTTTTVSDPPLDSGQEFKRRNKSKEKFEFDENNAQIFRLKLDDAHLHSGIYFKEYWFVSLCKVLIVLARVVSFEKSASKRSEKQLSVIIGVLGFLICSGVLSSVLDFDLGSIDGFGKFSVAVLMSCVVAFLYMPGGKNARSFWLGSDQL